MSVVELNNAKENKKFMKDTTEFHIDEIHMMIKQNGESPGLVFVGTMANPIPTKIKLFFCAACCTHLINALDAFEEKLEEKKSQQNEFLKTKTGEA